MPNKIPSSQATKILYLGHTGAGKTGSLASLGAAGYTVRILNLDSAPEILFGEAGYIYNPASPYRRAKPGLWTQEQADSLPERMSYVTLSEGYRITGTQAVPKGDSWHKIHLQLNDWKDGDLRFGNIGTWNDSDVLVVDNCSRLCESAMNYQLAINGRLGQRPRVGNTGENDYSAAYNLILNFFDLLKSDDIKCSIIFIGHITFLDDGPTENRTSRTKKGFPQTIGPMLSPRIGQYFAHSLMAKSVGTGPSLRRVIITHNDEMVELKNTAPLKVKSEYDLSTGLAEYFRDIRLPPEDPK